MTEKIKKSMSQQIKNLAQKIIKIDERVKEKKQDIDNGDTNLFFRNIFGDDLLLITKVMQSLQTSFGMSFYEQACKILGEHVGYQVNTQYVLEGNITLPVSSYIERTVNDYNYIPNRSQEQSAIDHLSVLIPNPKRYPDSIVDVFIKKPNGEEIYIDITTVKPNKKEFRTMKRKTLEWYALRKSTSLDAQVKPFIAIPYNPQSLTTNNYNMHTAQYDREDLLVGDELWMLASNNIFGLNDMNKIFQEIGYETKQAVNNAFKK